jgi:hypothetical protein
MERKETMKQCFIYSQSEACQNLQEKFFFSVTESYNKHYEVKDIWFFQRDRDIAIYSSSQPVMYISYIYAIGSVASSSCTSCSVLIR